MDQILESHFGGSNNNSNGGEADGYCPKCRADMVQTVIDDTEIERGAEEKPIRKVSAPAAAGRAMAAARPSFTSVFSIVFLLSGSCYCAAKPWLPARFST